MAVEHSVGPGVTIPPPILFHPDAILTFGRNVSERHPGIPMSDTDDFIDGLLKNLPHLRAFARMIARDHALAEDLVQDTVMQALAKRSQFRPGTNLKGWLIIILRNRFFNEMRRSSRKCEISVEHLGDIAEISGGQEINIEIRDFNRAFRQLPPAQREALTLVGASGFSYEEAAEIAGCPIGTMKSRVSRARLDLQEALKGVVNVVAWKTANTPQEIARRRRLDDCRVTASSGGRH
jgi:RNA polymerase sigma-70 factor (ECF subfamily)